MNFQNREIDILAVGEALIDFIGQQAEVSIENTSDYHRFLGGSPTNVAVNTSRLGLNTTLVATLGKDSFGCFVEKRLLEEKVNVQYVRKTEGMNTSIIFVSRTDRTPEFVPIREADFQIIPEQVPSDILANSKIFHTTCFALSRDPARTTILNKAREAHECGCQLSIDVNYARKLWDSRESALKAIQSYCKFDPLVKVSEDDMNRLFDRTVSHQEIFDFFGQAGVGTVCLTLGGQGVKLALHGKESIQRKAVKIDKVKDATGAGDAFWAGFLYAFLKSNSLDKALEVGQQLAALKLQNLGQLPENIQVVSKLL